MGKKHYYDKKKKLRPDGTVNAGVGKKRPHHAKIGKKGVKNEHQRKQAEIDRIHNTPNKYQTPVKKMGETPDGRSEVYEWYEDNGHEDHIQKKTAYRIKDESDMPFMLNPPSKKYQENFTEIFGEKERGVNVKGGYKKFKKTY
jgi:hypothetical protein